MSSCRHIASVHAWIRQFDVGVGRFNHVISSFAGTCAPATAQRHVTTGAATSTVRPLQSQFQDASPRELRQLQPYQRAKRPKPWPETLLGIELNAARNRPLNKNRKNFDRQITKQTQIAKDAWQRKENKWKNEQKKRADAEKRWALRREILKAESDGAYLFQSEYDKQLKKRLTKAQYLEPKRGRQRSRRKPKR